MSRLEFIEKKKASIIEQINTKSTELSTLTVGQDDDVLRLVDELVVLKTELRILNYALDLFPEYIKPKGFGERNDYKKGEIVVWNGVHPAILVIKEKVSDNFYSSESSIYSHLHYSNLRPATLVEQEIMRNNTFIPLKQHIALIPFNPEKKD